jgi:serine/threonine protein kinase/tetratricopeptide (TPR) repeat protein
LLFLRGQASGMEASVVEEHLRQCPSCLATVAGLAWPVRLPIDSASTVRESDGAGPYAGDERSTWEAADGDGGGETLLDETEVLERSDGLRLQGNAILALGAVGARLSQVTTVADGADGGGELAKTLPLDAWSHGPVPHPYQSFLADSFQVVTGATLAGFDPSVDLDRWPEPGLTVPAGTWVVPPRPEVGLVPGYEILQELGRGGMGVVYKARQLKLQRVVALKMILAGAHAGPSSLARFRAEAAAVAQLQHPNIVQIYETGECEGRPYFSLEYVEGGSLEQRTRENSLAPRESAELVETLARTMGIAHEHGIIHRDLKPGNILLAAVRGQLSTQRSGQYAIASLTAQPDLHTVPKIADFGLAKRVNDDAGPTQTGAVMGTPCYMAPEQAAGHNREIGPAADIYALGAIFYELLARRPPFKAGNPVDTMKQVLEQEPVPPRQLEPRVPRDLETVCLKCLEKIPARRYATAVELADDLRRFLDGEPILARPTSALERAWKWGKRRPALVALLGVSVAAVLAMVLFVVWHNVSLRGELDQARREERLARAREHEALETERLLRVAAEGQTQLSDARLAAAAGSWVDARLHATRALATVGQEPRLEQLKAPSQALLDQAEARLRDVADRQASDARFRQFGQFRDEALFLGCLYTGMDLAANLKATREVVQRALDVYGISTRDDAPPAFDAYLDDARKAALRDDCYQLLLILAETGSRAAPGKGASGREPALRESVRLLEQSLRFGVPSRAYHLRKARYLEQLGDKDSAALEDRAAAAAPIRDTLDHFLVADEFYRRADFEAAIREFDQVLQRNPAHFWAQYLDALCLLRLRRPAEARAQLGACLAQRSDFVWLYLLRGFAHAELKEFDEAETDYRTALQKPLDEFARYVLLVNRAVLRVRQGRLDDAIADLKAAIALKPGEYQAHVNLAQAYRQRKELGRALESLDRAVALEPTLAHVLRLRARLHLERREPALALRDFEQAVRFESADSPFQADDHVELGRLLLGESRNAEALASFDAALRLRHDHGPGQRLRAEALFRLGRYAEVIEALDHYLGTGKPTAAVHEARGLARAELGKYPGAIEDYSRALELEPTARVQTYRGWAHLLCEAPKLALRDFELALQLDPSSADALTGRGLILASQGHHRDALRDAREAVRRGPPSPRLLYNAARIHAQCGGDEGQRALELIRQALGLLPADKRGAFWARYIRQDPALRSIRRHPRFQELALAISQRP